jgi:hypothetical protein
MTGRPQQPLEWARERRAAGETIGRLAENPETVKDAAILWLTIQLEEALTKLARIRAAGR